MLAGSMHYFRSALVKIRRRGCVLGILDGILSRRGYTYHYIQMKLVARWKGDSRSHSPTIYFVFMVLFIYPFSNFHSQSRDAVNYPPKGIIHDQLTQEQPSSRENRVALTLDPVGCEVGADFCYLGVCERSLTFYTQSAHD